MFRLDQAFVPSLAAEALRVAEGASTYVLKASNASGETAFGQSTGLNHIRIGDIHVPTDAGGGVYLKFRHFKKAAYIPAWKVLAGEVPQEDIEGRIILVGTSAPGLLDLRATPVDAAVPGIDIHAQVLEHLLTGNIPGASRLCGGARRICNHCPRDNACYRVAACLRQGLRSHWCAHHRLSAGGRMGRISIWQTSFLIPRIRHLSWAS